MIEEAPLFRDVAEAPEGGRAFWLDAADGARLRAAIWEGAGAGSAFVFPGRTEYIEKYGRVVRRLQARGLSGIVIDWRGQGLSTRTTPAPGLGHIDDFRDYQRDVAALLAHPLARGLPRPWHLFAHSMGGCIALRTLLEGEHFATATLSAPMWRLCMKAATRELAARMARVAQLVRLVRLGPRDAARPAAAALDAAFRDNALTSDPEHFAWCAGQIAAHPELALGGPSLQWTRAAIEEMTRLLKAPPPAPPILTLLGTDEAIVSSSLIRAQVARMKQGRLVELQGARHEIFMERPEIQTRIWAAVDAFLPAQEGRLTGSGG